MKSHRLRFWLGGAAIVGTVATLLVFSDTKAIAQIRAALVKNVDEPYRTPWTTRSQFLPNAGGCFGTSDCFNYSEGTTFAVFDLRPVPAGKRWVVESATGGLNSGYGKTISIEFGSPRTNVVFDGLKWIFGGPFLQYSSFGAAAFSANLHATFEPGETPFVRVSVPSGSTLNGYSVLVFSGYLIDATN